jgi:hypothetical protein
MSAVGTFRTWGVSDLSPLSQAKRKSNLRAVRSAYDPKRTSGLYDPYRLTR